MTEAAVRVEGVTKTFGKFTAVDNLDLTIPRGEIYGFLGPNGAGKTTTIRMIMGIFHPDRGTIHVLGQPGSDALKSRLGYLPEEKGLYKKMTALEILIYFGRLKGLAKAVASQRARELLERYGLGASIDARCESLSKGMGQKVQILGTIMHEPDLVIFDEPFSGLDPVNAEVMRDLVLDLKRKGTTVIFSTHVMSQAEQLCDHVFLIHRARKVLDGPLSAVKGTEERGLLLDYDGDGQHLHGIEGVERVNDSGKQAELYLGSGVDPQAILRQLIDRVQVRRFDLREPSLHEIFVRAVGDDVDG